MHFLIGALLALVTAANAGLYPRQSPANATGVKTITSPQNVTMRYTEPGICETTNGVKSYAGYIDLDAESHTFFWFFEARNNSKEAPITLWLNGGPGSDSLIGLFDELGPCSVLPDLTTQLNPYAWNEVSNLLFISQPLGVGFSYSSEGIAGFNKDTDTFQSNSPFLVGNYPVINASAIDTTELAAIATWHILQGFLGNLPQLDPDIQSREFNLWTESYGGHYGPAFFSYFNEQNALIADGSQPGVQLSFSTLGIINGIVDYYTQAPFYPEFAVHNTYGITAYNETIYNYAKFATSMSQGCLEQIEGCVTARQYGSSVTFAYCTEAANMCRDNVEGMFYFNALTSAYDIRLPASEQTTIPPRTWTEYVNQTDVKHALGVDLDYLIEINNDVFFAFQQTGDWVYPDFLPKLAGILESGLRVTLVYGDADYTCNWFGGEAVSLAINYTHAGDFAAAGYQPFVVNGTQYGDTREFGNLSFTRVYEAGHAVPYYQPQASLELFRRAIFGFDIADGLDPAGNFSSVGNGTSTHTESSELPSSTASVMSSSSVLSSGNWTSTATDSLSLSSTASVNTGASVAPSGYSTTASVNTVAPSGTSSTTTGSALSSSNTSGAAQLSTTTLQSNGASSASSVSPTTGISSSTTTPSSTVAGSASSSPLASATSSSGTKPSSSVAGTASSKSSFAGVARAVETGAMGIAALLGGAAILIA